jgi:AraC-like DNA-binding protein
MVETGARYGVSAAVITIVSKTLEELGAPPRGLEQRAVGYVDGRAADAMLDDAAAALADPAVGIAIARRISPGALGLLDYALFTGERWGDAIRRVAQFYGVVTERVTMSIEDDGETASVTLTRHPLHVQNRHWVELSFGVITERARLAIGSDFRLRGVELQHPAPERDAGHERYFGAPVRFGAPKDRLVFSSSLLAAPLRTGAAVLADALEHRLAELVPPVLDPAMVGAREAIGRGIDERDVTLETVAGRLGMSARSLQRTLRERGTTFKDLVDEIRRDRALALLQTNTLTVVEIGRRLGFVDPTAFFRAFRRWTGTTPGSQRGEVGAAIKPRRGRSERR